MTKSIRLFFLLIFYADLAAIAEWTILLVMQGDNNLSFAMHHNIALLKRSPLLPHVNILVQWDEPMKHKTFRYRLGGGNFLDDASQKQDMGINPELELVDAAKWAFIKYPSKKRALVLWNHGSGVLDEKHNWKNYRGILYDFSSGKCLTNTGLLRALSVIQADVLNGGKFDLIGMDACLMAMLEIAYQIHSFGKFFIAAENITLTPGWHYEEISKFLVQSPRRCSKEKLSHKIVQSFEQLNKHRTSHYTQSIMNLSKIIPLKESVASFARHCLLPENCKIFLPCIVKARLACTQFDRGNFIDLYDFYTLVKKEIGKNELIPPELKQSTLSLLGEAQKLILDAVVDRVQGKHYRRTKGISIYFPLGKKVHKSYANTLFAGQTMWQEFIEYFAVTK